MPLESASFFFTVTLAGVVNGLGVVRWLNGFTEYLRCGSFRPYWVFSLTALFQFLLHILFWWSLWGIRGNVSINFLSYLYLLSGPILLFVATALLLPSFDGDALDLEAHYSSVSKKYATVLSLLWLWAIFSSPLLRGSFAPTAPIFAVFFGNAVVMRVTRSRRIHGATALINWFLFVGLIGTYFLQIER